jgi:hypothetical protein
MNFQSSSWWFLQRGHLMLFLWFMCIKQLFLGGFKFWIYIFPTFLLSIFLICTYFKNPIFVYYYYSNIQFQYPILIYFLVKKHLELKKFGTESKNETMECNWNEKKCNLQTFINHKFIQISCIKTIQPIYVFTLLMVQNVIIMHNVHPTIIKTIFHNNWTYYQLIP